MKETYKQGWNDYLDGIAYNWITSKAAWREGWIDCRDASRMGKQFKR